MRREPQPEQRSIIGIGEAEHTHRYAAQRSELPDQFGLREWVYKRTFLDPENKLPGYELNGAESGIVIEDPKGLTMFTLGNRPHSHYFATTARWEFSSFEFQGQVSLER